MQGTFFFELGACTSTPLELHLLSISVVEDKLVTRYNTWYVLRVAQDTFSVVKKLGSYPLAAPCCL